MATNSLDWKAAPFVIGQSSMDIGRKIPYSCVFVPPNEHKVTSGMLCSYFPCIPNCAQLQGNGNGQMFETLLIRREFMPISQKLLTRLSGVYPSPLLRAESIYSNGLPDKSGPGSRRYTPASRAATSSRAASLNDMRKKYFSGPKSSRRASQ